MKRFTLFGAISATLLLSACATSGTTTPVITRTDASHETIGLGATKLKAQESALATAKKTMRTQNACHHRR